MKLTASKSYVIRFLIADPDSDPADDGLLPQLRIRLEDPHTGQITVFKTLEALYDFVHTQLDTESEKRKK